MATTTLYEQASLQAKEEYLAGREATALEVQALAGFKKLAEVLEVMDRQPPHRGTLLEVEAKEVKRWFTRKQVLQVREVEETPYWPLPESHFQGTRLYLTGEGRLAHAYQGYFLPLRRWEGFKLPPLVPGEEVQVHLPDGVKSLSLWLRGLAKSMRS